jgi:hypothetical protein
MECEKNAPQNGCSSTVECLDDLERTPAATLILRGFTKVNKVSNTGFYDMGFHLISLSFTPTFMRA